MTLCHAPEGTHRMICQANHARCKGRLRDGVSDSEASLPYRRSFGRGVNTPLSQDDIA